LVAMTGFYGWQAPRRLFAPPKNFPSPQVFQGDKRELLVLNAAQRSLLNGTGTNPASVSIEKAMQMIVERGANAYAQFELVS
jgi:hypothetical protein